MTGWVAVCIALAVGAVTAAGVGVLAMRDPPASSMRTNIQGRSVPVVLGWSILAGGGAGLLVVALWARDGATSLLQAALSLLVLAFLAGWWDDRKGDERPRGFRGHLGALRTRTLTGGMVKLLAVAGSGLLAMSLLLKGVTPPAVWLLGAMTIALSANLINLMDRAPGRASKVFLLVSACLAIFADGWWLVGAGTVGAAIATLPRDLRAKAMLGDAGANPMGAILGLGFVLASSGSSLVLSLMVVGLLALNLASEKWSFSKVIENTSWLARLDHLGRK